MHRALRAACLSAAAFVIAFAPAAEAKKADKAQKASERLQRAVTLGGLYQHLEAFQEIADANGGDRFAGYPGYDASAAYVFSQLEKAGYEPEYQEFEYLAYIEDGPTVFEDLSTTPPTALPASDMSYSGAGDVTGDLQTPSGDAQGCEAADFAGFTAGAVALVSRGTCTFRTKVNNAIAAGAVAVVVYNNVPGELAGTLAADEGQAAVPAIGISQELGQQLVARAAGADDPVRIVVSSHTEQLATRNVIAETRRGDSDNVVMAGAHLDSVHGGPGINDNASGSAALLEIARKLNRIGKPANKVRFAWWSAEESGLVGATHYVNELSEDEAGDIALYLNFDMIASPNFARFVYDGSTDSAGSGAIEELFTSYFASRGLPSEPTPFNGRSDYGPFIAIDIPAGGLFTGAEGVKTAQQAALYGGTAGVAFDPCYHQPCDDIDNVSLEALDQNSDAIAHAIATYAYSTSAVNGQAATAKAAKRKQARAAKFRGHAALR